MRWHCSEHADWTTDSPFVAQKHRFQKHPDEFGKGGKQSVTATGPMPERNRAWGGQPPRYPIPPGGKAKLGATWGPAFPPPPKERPEPDHHVPSEGAQVRARGKSDAAKVIRRGE